MRRQIPLALALTSLAALLPSARAQAAAPHTHIVVIAKMKFGEIPPQVTVGDTIVWVNRDIFRHTATASNGSFNIDLPPGKSARMTVRKNGVTSFHCKYHPGMRGVLRIAGR